MPIDDKLDFSSVLATAVHDMKNSLWLLTRSTEALALQAKEQGRDESEELSRLHYEVSRLNGSLMQLLALYRFEKGRMPLTIEEVYIAELLQDLGLKHLTYTQQKQIDIEIDVDEDLNWYLDSVLLEYLLNDILVNALRYCRKQIKISAEVVDNQLYISIEDDGDGFPKEILDLANREVASSANFVKNRSGLGLFFAKIIAKAHNNNDQVGKILLSNKGALGGSKFTICFP